MKRRLEDQMKSYRRWQLGVREWYRTSKPESVLSLIFQPYKTIRFSKEQAYIWFYFTEDTCD